MTEEAARESVDAEPEATQTDNEPASETANDAAETSDQETDLDAMAKLEDDVADLKDRLLRARADYDNLVKRQQRDAALERERVKARVLEGFLQVYEYGRMAVLEAEKNPSPLAEGVKMIQREFDRLLEGEGVVSLGTVGEPFDKAIHEAIGEEPAQGVKPGHVSRVVQPGYRLGERILRFAKVAVAPS